MLEICQILLICLTLCSVGVGAVLLARASLAQLVGLGKIALEGCVRLNGSWLDELAEEWSLLSWNAAHRPPPRGVFLIGKGLVRAVSVTWGAPPDASPPLASRRL